MHVFTATTWSDYCLRDSYLLDSVANGHICNKCLRFYDLTPATEDDFLYADNAVISIEAFGTIDITVKTSLGPADITLYDTALVSSFHMSVIFARKFKAKNVY